MAILVIALGIASVGCCRPHINRFAAIPPVICEGQQAVLRWDARGDLAMTVAGRSLLSTDPCAASGREVIDLVLVAGAGPDEDPRPIQVLQLHNDAREPVELSTTAIEGKNLVARGEKGRDLWSDRIEIATVAACGARSIEVRHEGRVVELPAGGMPSNALAGTPLHGMWEMRSPMSVGELKDPHARPPTLDVIVNIRCRDQVP